MTERPTIRTLIGEHWNLARTLRVLEIRFHPERCTGAWECYEVCPVECWKPDYQHSVIVFQHGERCIACGACVLQCPEGAIALEVPNG